MIDRLKARLEGLRNERDLGQARLAKLDGQAAELRAGLLRIEGAIQVLEEAMNAEGEERDPE